MFVCLFVCLHRSLHCCLRPTRQPTLPCPAASPLASLQKAGVADPNAFKDRPEILMYGMLCVMIAAAFWDIFRCGRVGGGEGQVWTHPCNPTS